MAAGDSLGQQFHEMTRQEFESQPGTWFHGSANSMPGSHGGPFHVGSLMQAQEALRKPPEGGGLVSSGVRRHSSYWADKPGIVGGRINVEMTNTPHIDFQERNQQRARDWARPVNEYAQKLREERPKWEVAPGIPRGELEQWPRVSSFEPHSDVTANGIAHRLGSRMKRGFYYVNAIEGEGGKPGTPPHKTIAAVLPNRKAFKTHEDYLVEARAQRKNIPQRALKGYTEIPGQGRMF